MPSSLVSIFVCEQGQIIANVEFEIPNVKTTYSTRRWDMESGDHANHLNITAC
jgi:hypothetical protein